MRAAIVIFAIALSGCAYTGNKAAKDQPTYKSSKAMQSAGVVKETELLWKLSPEMVAQANNSVIGPVVLEDGSLMK